MDEDLNKDKRSIRLKMIGFYIMILNAIICVSSFAIIVLDLINAVKENPLFVLVLPFAIFMFVGPYIDGIISILLYHRLQKKEVPKAMIAHHCGDYLLCALFYCSVFIVSVVVICLQVLLL